MTDDATLKLNVDATSVKGASASLDQFSESSKRAAGAAGTYGAASDRMTRQLTMMLAQQRETNQLLQQSIGTSRQNTDAIDHQTTRMTHLAVAVGVGAAAYQHFSNRASEASKAAASVASPQTIQAYAQLGSAIGALSAQLDGLARKQAGVFTGIAAS